MGAIAQVCRRVAMWGNWAIAPHNSKSCTKNFQGNQAFDVQASEIFQCKINETAYGTYYFNLYSKLIKALWFTNCP